MQGIAGSLARSLERKALILTVVLGCQVLAAMFFALDVAGDITDAGLGWHLSIELGATLALAAGVVVGAIHVRSLIERARQDQAMLAAARGAMGALIRARFAEWHLTAAEADVALFAIKGLDVSEIAGLRGSAQGTVRAQLTRIYAKAGTTSQTGLIALFMDELIDPTTALEGQGDHG
ncbi:MULTISPECIES: helix-turn-helix transcriptional regulator [unclassified Novosphingobium]|uniref:helix-turn-helix transcriptional regulator n=1 Tax=unclassified Novosphingobium TaxID=2644732 RepID=UPI00146F232D|nr:MULTISPECIES: helix-turn-helix transcriptional regulator [unclassified Novosphingobium]NMN07595.1 DNA-binding CsgD family transcriptional regulator [Novosphingobium sp. SG919]NMN89880.1 DNA-binding CsgD family transcriptional regulator [Novosphingobium sp. SG916]